MNVGFIGIGNMGGPLARRLLNKASLTVFDNSAERVDTFVAEGAQAADSPQELATRSGIVLTCLPSSKEVRQVIFGENGLIEGLAPGSLIADMSAVALTYERLAGARIRSGSED